MNLTFPIGGGPASSGAHTASIGGWSGGTAPTGATDHTYSWSRSGPLVLLRIRLRYATAGVSNTAAYGLSLPTNAPTPRVNGSQSGANTCHYTGYLTVRTSDTASPAGFGNASIVRNSGDSAWEIYCASFGTVGVKILELFITYESAV